jgi:thiol-disulfide isomerase/thioredoxin
MRLLVVAVALGAALLTCCSRSVAQTPTPEQALQYRPAQKDVEYDIPAPGDVKRCKVELERGEGVSGFAVFDPNGLTLRRYVDSNNDRYIDQWRYYQNGIEVYRDIDNNANNRADESRWLNTGGTRWGFDKNEDGRIDHWKLLSAEEASRVAIFAMINSDAELLATVLVTAADLKTLGVSAALTGRILRQVQEPAASLRTVMQGSTVLTPKSVWRRFDAAMPGIIPKDDGKATADLFVYESTMAIVETNNQHGLVVIGEMVKVGDVWKLTQVPKPMSGNTVTVARGTLMQPDLDSQGVVSQELSPEMRGLIEQLERLDEKQPAGNATPAQVIEHLQNRNQVIERLVAAARGADEFDTWVRQLINGLSTAVQYGDSRSGARLTQIRQELAQKEPKGDIVAYAMYRQMLAEYSLDLRNAKSPDAQQKVQGAFLNALKDFIGKFPQAEDSIDAMLQLAMNAEFSADLEEAKKWYGQLIAQHDGTPAGIRAQGAMRRLNLKGKVLDLQGASTAGQQVSVSNLKGKTVLVVFWASWSEQFVKDLPVLRALYEQYRPRGFEVLGVNLDQTPDLATGFDKQNRVTWPSIFEPGSLDSPISKQFGILTVPTMLLVDRTGKVTHINLTVSELQEQIGDALGAQ